MWADALTQKYLFFTGKGGVGKTSLSCATALHLASLGRKVLIVSTDPASNLDEVLQVALGPEPRSVPGIISGCLFAANLDPDMAAEEYRERAVGPYRGILPDTTLRQMEEQLSGACTTEIAAFDEFTRLLCDDAIGSAFDNIVFDTAPTGHTLRLLSLPAAWNGFIDESAAGGSGTTCIGPLAALKQQQARYRDAIDTLTDSAVTLVVLVARPDAGSLAEASRAAAEMQGLNILNIRLIVNGVFHRSLANSDRIAEALEQQGRTAIEQMPANLTALSIATVPLHSFAVVGLEAIGRLLEPSECAFENLDTTDCVSPTDTLDTLIDSMSDQKRGLIMTMGKGGVGKTTLASEIAVRLAKGGHNVLLTTTDPAAHIRLALNRDLPNLELERIDPRQEVDRYRQELIHQSQGVLSTESLAVLEEDLRSPCTEEIAIFRAFAVAVARASDRFVVIDTAPTGHTLLLMDAAEAYHREILRTQTNMPEAVRQLLPRLRDPDYTHVFVIALPEPTPVHEASSLQEDLRRAGIEPYAWIVNQCLSASETRDPLLLARASHEETSLSEVSEIATRYAWVPWTDMTSAVLQKGTN